MIALMEHPEHDAMVALVRLDPKQEEYDAIRALWQKHSIAEDSRDLPGLISTLTEDCVYEIVGTDQRWEGHEGAARFYTELLGRFPDIHFDLTDIVIGPQGVSEAARVSGVPNGPWSVIIFFPWDPERRLFKGERIYADASWATTGPQSSGGGSAPSASFQ
jgi:SnoaL-like domain